ncbi:MAG: tetratricopeptide repeat protein [Deltaproteobacteria bacterium]|nr:tetratricopeptide repeat protein [Deltaproteobacteria bacterium]
MAKPKIDSTLSPAAQALIRCAMEKLNISPEEMDGSAGSEADGLITYDEGVHAVMNSPQWQKCKNIRHPLDLDSIPLPIKQRIASLKKQTDAEIGLSEKDPGYCDAFVPTFFQKGLPSYKNGGLGFTYPFTPNANLFPMLSPTPGFRQKFMDAELTAAEAYQGVLNPKLPYGSCSEAEAKIIAAFRATGVPCDVHGMRTQGHVYAQYKDKPLDPSGIGEIGWSVPQSDGQIASVYYSSLALGENDPAKKLTFQKIAIAIDPDSYTKSIFLAERLRITKKPELAVTVLLQGAEEQPHDIAVFQALANEILMEPDAKVVSQHVRTLMSLMPDNPYAFYAMQMVCSARKIFTDEEAWLLKNFPMSGHSEALRSLEALSSGNMKEALTWAQEALFKNPRHAMALQVRANLRLTQGDFANAEADVIASIQEAQNLPVNFAMWSTIASMAGKTDEAYLFAKRESINAGLNPQGLVVLAQAALNAGDLEASYKTVKDFIDLPLPDAAKLGGFQIMAWTLDLMGRTDEAITLTEQVLQLPFPEQAKSELHAQLAFFFTEKAEHQKAFQHAEQAHQLNPASPGTKLAMNNALLSLGKRVEALQVAQEMVDTASQTSFSWVVFSKSARLLNRKNEAVEALDKALSLNPRDFGALIEKALLSIEANDEDMLRTTIEDLRTKYKNYGFVHSIDAFASWKLGEHKHALREAKIGLKKNPHDQFALMVTGFSAMKEKKFREAIVIGERLQKLYPFDPAGGTIAAEAYFNLGKLKEAEHAARQGITAYPYDAGFIPEISPYTVLAKILNKTGDPSGAAKARETMMWNRANPGPHEHYEHPKAEGVK